jgi:acetyltransferase-like isoleucine patch superfamily enzyme
MKVPGFVKRPVKAVIWCLLPRHLRRYRARLDAWNAVALCFFQRVLGINRGVPWPVHWSSSIPSPRDGLLVCRSPSTWVGHSPGVCIDAGNGVALGQNLLVGPGAKILSSVEGNGGAEGGRVVIGDNCWLGANAVIMPGVRLGNHVVVAAGAVVNESFPEDDILLVGQPARMAGRLGPYRGTEQP